MYADKQDAAEAGAGEVGPARQGLSTPVTGDTSIIEGPAAPPVYRPSGEPLHITVGANVYSTDGDLVAIVEITDRASIGVRAGQPGRSIVVPASGIARVTADGRRVEIYATTEKVRSLSADREPGSKHLEAQQPETLARGAVDSDSADDSGNPAASAPAQTGPAVEDISPTVAP